MNGDGCCTEESLLRRDLDDAAIQLAEVGFAALWRRHRRYPAELLPGTSVDEAVVALAASGRAELDDDGRVIGIHGLTLRATRHRFNHAGVDHHTWCAFDAIGIPAALNLDAVAHSDCPACRRSLTIEIHDGAVPDRRQVRDLALWLPEPAGGHLINDFCATADAFCSADHLRQRIDDRTARGQIIDLEEAIALGRDTWADVSNTVADLHPPARERAPS